MLVAGLAALAALCAPAAAPAAEKGVMPDLTWGTSTTDQDRTAALLAQTKTQWVRLEIRWYEVETSNDSYSKTKLAEIDRAIDLSVQSGAKVIAMVHRSPNWASGTKDTYMPPKDPAHYAEFVAWLANRYRDKVAAFEIWNEQNSTRFWPSGPNAAEYVNLLKPAYAAIKQTDPAVKVIFGGLVFNDYAYVEQAYAAGAKGHFDAMIVHPYPCSNAPEFVYHASDGRIHKDAFTGYREVRKSMLAAGDDKPIWFTEFGWATTTQLCGVSEQVQADYLGRAFKLVEQDPYVHVAVVYNFRNNHWGNDVDSWEGQLGLMYTDFTPKKAFYTYGNYTGRIVSSTSTTTSTTTTSTTTSTSTTSSSPTTSTTTSTSPATSTTTTSAPKASTAAKTSKSPRSKRRTRTSLGVRSGRRARTARNRRARGSSARSLVVYGRVSRATRGSVTIRIQQAKRRRTRAGLSWRTVVSRRVKVSADGRYRIVLPRSSRKARWRMKASYHGTSEHAKSSSRTRYFRSQIPRA